MVLIEIDILLSTNMTKEIQKKKKHHVNKTNPSINRLIQMHYVQPSTTAF